jgi:hypothetical protein
MPDMSDPEHYRELLSTADAEPAAGEVGALDKAPIDLIKVEVEPDPARVGMVGPVDLLEGFASRVDEVGGAVSEIAEVELAIDLTIALTAALGPLLVTRARALADPWLGLVLLAAGTHVPPGPDRDHILYRDVGQAVPAHRQRHRQVEQDLGRVVHRRRRPPRRERGRQATVEPDRPRGLGHQDPTGL